MEETMTFDRPDPSSEPSAKEEAQREIAGRLESEHPLWIVVYGGYSAEFVCFPKFSAPMGTMVVARYPAAIPERMRRLEEAFSGSMAAA
jgi:hypothetical protein